MNDVARGWLNEALREPPKKSGALGYSLVSLVVNPALRLASMIRTVWILLFLI